MKKLINHVSARRPLFLIVQKHPLSPLFVIGSAVHGDGGEAGVRVSGSAYQHIPALLCGSVWGTDNFHWAECV